MESKDFYDAVEQALNHYNDLDVLEKSDLRTLQALWPLHPSLLNKSLNFPLRGFAIHHFIDRALTRLAEKQPEASKLLILRCHYSYSNSEIQSQLGLTTSTFQRYLKDAVKKLSSVILEIEAETVALQEDRVNYQLTFVPPALRETFVGLSHPLEQFHTYLRHRLVQPKTPILVTGLGGIGKSSLITHALTTWITRESPAIERILWVRVTSSAGDHSVERVIDLILSQIGQQLEVALLVLPLLEQRVRHLANHLHRFRQRFVIVIDNVESAIEHEGALQFAKGIASTALVVIGSRRDPELSEGGTAILQVQELSPSDAHTLATLEAKPDIPSSDIEQIVKAVGGHPLALLLVVALRRRLPLAEVLADLGQPSRLAGKLYERIYMRSWNLLSEIEKSVLIGLTVLPIEGAYLRRVYQIAHVANPNVTHHQVEEAITELTTLNLLQVSERKDPIYSLHRLTYRFIEQRIGIATLEDP